MLVGCKKLILRKLGGTARSYIHPLELELLHVYKLLKKNLEKPFHSLCRDEKDNYRGYPRVSALFENTRDLCRALANFSDQSL